MLLLPPLMPHPLTSELGGLVFITSSHSLRQMGCVEMPGEEKNHQLRLLINYAGACRDAGAGKVGAHTHQPLAAKGRRFAAREDYHLLRERSLKLAGFAGPQKEHSYSRAHSAL